MEVRIAQPDEMPAVYRLVHDEFVKAGFAQQQLDGELRYYEDLDGIPETTCLVAVEDDGRIVGTLSLTRDSDAGIHTDYEFSKQTDHIREWCYFRHKRLCSGWRIVTDPKYRNSRRVLLALAEAFIGICVEEDLDCSLYTFNPKHTRLYERLFGFEQWAVSEAHIGCSCNEAVLMFVTTERLVEHWEKLNKRGNQHA